MASPFTTVKGDEFTRLTPAGIIRCLQVQDPACRWRDKLREQFLRQIGYKLA
jgi:hypothetical protein